MIQHWNATNDTAITRELSYTVSNWMPHCKVWAEPHCDCEVGPGGQGGTWALGVARQSFTGWEGWKQLLQIWWYVHDSGYRQAPSFQGEHLTGHYNLDALFDNGFLTDGCRSYAVAHWLARWSHSCEILQKVPALAHWVPAKYRSFF